MAKRTYQILIFILIVAVAVFAYELFYRSGDEQVPGGFERIAYVRNQNNMVAPSPTTPMPLATPRMPTTKAWLAACRTTSTTR